MTDLTQAIAEVKRVNEVHGKWPEGGPSHLHRAINHILNAVATGELIPKADAAEAEIATLRAQVERLTDAGTRALALLRADGRGDTDIAMSQAGALRETTHD